MTYEGVRAAEEAAKRFLALAKRVEQEQLSTEENQPVRTYHYIHASKVSGELRRASLDLTRRLEEMRRS